MRTVVLIVISLALASCNLDKLLPEADEQFGRQNFNSAIALIELHKTRTGEYPAKLEDIRFLGDWDQIWLSAVRYERTNNGYNLFVERGWLGKPDLVYPEDFRVGLGLEENNIEWE